MVLQVCSRFHLTGRTNIMNLTCVCAEEESLSHSKQYRKATIRCLWGVGSTWLPYDFELLGSSECQDFLYFLVHRVLHFMLLNYKVKLHVLMSLLLKIYAKKGSTCQPCLQKLLLHYSIMGHSNNVGYMWFELISYNLVTCKKKKVCSLPLPCFESVSLTFLPV